MFDISNNRHKEIVTIVRCFYSWHGQIFALFYVSRFRKCHRCLQQCQLTEDSLFADIRIWRQTTNKVLREYIALIVSFRTMWNLLKEPRARPRSLDLHANSKGLTMQIVTICLICSVSWDACMIALYYGWKASDIDSERQRQKASERRIFSFFTRKTTN